MNILGYATYLIGGLILGTGVILVFFKGRGIIDVEKRKKEAQLLMEKVQTEAGEIIENIKKQTEKYTKNLEEWTKNREERLKKIEASIENKEKNLFKKEERINEARLKIAAQKEETQKFQEMAKLAKEKILENLARKVNKSPAEIRASILERNERELEMENQEKLKSKEETLKEDAPKIAKNILIYTLQRLGAPTSVETKTVTINVPKDFIKGKVVGKDAANIEEIETQFPDVAIVFNDLPNTISIAYYNLVTRRIAQKTIEKLVNARGEIDKNVIAKVKKEAEKEVGEELYSIGGGFLHDLGKAIDQDPNVQDAHDRLTKEIMEKYGFSWEEVHAAWTHHDAEPQKTPEALIVKAADAASAGRPGARQESLFSYIERIKALENIATSYEGVQKVFTMSAGRELRVFVDPSKIEDKNLEGAARKIAGEIEENVGYPGKIKVNIIRKIEATQITNVK
ncbi:DUF3552 domain-containing protein [Candidatus Peregrinibacteria bacterium]|nr:DUF3552 domain-containing protein [Candidatus Peregrinibacteria bacterium]